MTKKITMRETAARLNYWMRTLNSPIKFTVNESISLTFSIGLDLNADAPNYIKHTSVSFTEEFYADLLDQLKGLGWEKVSMNNTGTIIWCVNSDGSYPYTQEEPTHA